MMELKKYQQEVINALDDYIEMLEDTKDLREAYRSFWLKRKIDIQRDSSERSSLRPYNNSITGVPNVTVKVPTAGGKTFIACSALKHLFAHHPFGKPKVVIWFVPSDTILKQTYRNLNDPQHSYRRRINVDFNGRVKVIRKEEALLAQGLKIAELKDNLTILVLSVQSFASENKETRKARRENENFAEHVAHYTYPDKMLSNADETSLLQVLAQLNPVLIIDESHNFEGSELRQDLQREINPSFILNLTATPRQNSNIICFVDSYRLKQANMVKLPVVVFNNKTETEVIANAIALQKSLEKRAQVMREHGGRYIRPIVLFQAQPKVAGNKETFEAIKDKLVKAGLPEKYIAIKTADKDELKNVDLMSEDCAIRYIITVNALKEGWDCPFAYILASLANRTSSVEVEQILGRILRQPYTAKHEDPMLNFSYVFTNSADFQNTLESIIDSLNKAGFSSKDYRVADEDPQQDEEPARTLFKQHFLDFDVAEGEGEEDKNNEEEIKTDIPNIESDTLKNEISEERVRQRVQDIEIKAQEQGEQYEESTKNIDEDDNSFNPTDMSDIYYMKDMFREDAEQVVLPVFAISASSDIFGEGNEVMLSKENLSDDIDITLADKQIDFTFTQPEAMRIDLEKVGTDEYVPARFKLKTGDLVALRENLKKWDTEGLTRQLSQKIADAIDFNDIPHDHIKKFAYDILCRLDKDKLEQLFELEIDTIQKFHDKLLAILQNYRYERFIDWLDMGDKIWLSLSLGYQLPKTITLNNPSIGIPKGLYKKEGDMNDFEEGIITAVANLDNVLYWHRNPERGRGFYINGFINHYPDFIVKMKSGRVVLIETKGKQLKNDDSKEKLELGKAWARKAGDSYRYFMVFKQDPLEGSVSIERLLQIMESL